VAGMKASFSLSEALFGLLPACVLPFLMRRIGYQKSLLLTLTTQAIQTERAYELGLVDYKTEDLNNEIRKLLLRLTRLEPGIIGNAKNYLSDLWIMNEKTKQQAISKINALAGSERVQNNIKKFLANGQFPWEHKH
jgi:polyketide biosynthesis enoyl-CoA hydratase PksH